MIKGLNVKGLCKQIKASKNNLIWSLKDGIHVITNRHWMITFEEIPKEVLVTLFSLFVKMPEEGTALQASHFNREVSELIAVDVDKIRETAKNGTISTLTNLFSRSGDLVTRIFKTSEGFLYVKADYMHAINEYGDVGEILSSGKHSPVLFKNINYLILPYRREHNLLEECLIEELTTK